MPLKNIKTERAELRALKRARHEHRADQILTVDEYERQRGLTAPRR
jgi:hypothetical protein